jgi:uncharacterized protein (TIGR03089 family)
VQAGRPFLTYYDDTTGERTELSFATFDNWVAKTANLLRDGLGLAPGEVVGLDLPDHWLTVAIAFAAWRAGAEVRCGAGDVTFTTEERLPAGGREVVGVVPGPARASLSRPYPGVTDYGDEVGTYPDTFDGDHLAEAAPPVPADPARRLVTGDVLAAALAAYRGRGGIVFGTIADPDRVAATERASVT